MVRVPHLTAYSLQLGRAFTGQGGGQVAAHRQPGDGRVAAGTGDRSAGTGSRSAGPLRNIMRMSTGPVHDN